MAGLLPPPLEPFGIGQLTWACWCMIRGLHYLTRCLHCLQTTWPSCAFCADRAMAAIPPNKSREHRGRSSRISTMGHKVIPTSAITRDESPCYPRNLALASTPFSSEFSCFGWLPSHVIIIVLFLHAMVYVNQVPEAF